MDKLIKQLDKAFADTKRCKHEISKSLIKGGMRSIILQARNFGWMDDAQRDELITKYQLD